MIITTHDPMSGELITPDEENHKNATYTHPLMPRLVTVESVTPLTARMVRIRVVGEDLKSLRSVAPEDHVKVFFDRDAQGAPVLPGVVGDRWVDGRSMTSRDYTIRDANPAEGWMDLDFVLHDHGVAGRWAGTAQPGEQLALLGPRGSFRVKDVFDWYVLAADETSLPALARWVGGLRPEAKVFAFVEVNDGADEIELHSPADLTVTWLHRNGAPAGGTDLLEQAVKSQQLPSGEGFVWVAGESMSIKPLRRYLKNDLGLDRDNWDVDGYWRRGQADHDHHHDED
ncbi:siderophore-interacting protein [Glutamicibacter uratoxydans]|uniref:Siderophore-interacting protein n=1 Tax=Glutamicibacter uratoxydans TaxID=43667 RepID=A0A4Y4DM29_GLUUR|nr:siderophore-interacting protein [Glutamicibacter uratoxydans]GED04894.1 siderophore-interacting protein [Glutamicibacter uratoxydans]